MTDTSFELQRLNDDSSWLVRSGTAHFLIDPWLFGDDINIAHWFSRQWLAAPTLTLAQLPHIDFIVISHPFSDHCSEQTLQHFPAETPVLAVPAAAKRIARMRHFTHIEVLRDSARHPAHPRARCGAIEVAFYAAEGWLDLTHNALSIRDTRSGSSLFYAPHGFPVPRAQHVRSELAAIKPQLLLTTFRHYGLPVWLGGDVNLGAEAALPLLRLLQPHMLIRTHDAQKHEAGIVVRIARQFIHPEPQQLLSKAGVTVAYKRAKVGEVLALQAAP